MPGFASICNKARRGRETMTHDFSDLRGTFDRGELVALLGFVAAELAAVDATDNLSAALEPAADATDNLSAASEPAGEHLETWVAAARFGIPDDTIRAWCRRHGIGYKPDGGGRWLVCVSKLRERVALSVAF